MAIDWSATGAMVGGLGGWAQAIMIGVAAYVGSQSLRKWRTQRIEDRRMDAAEQILSLAYRTSDNIEAIRSRGISGQAMNSAEKTLRDQLGEEEWNKTPASRQRHLTSRQVILDRVNSFQSDWAEYWQLKPRARAYFGETVAGTLMSLWSQVTSIIAANEVLNDLHPNDEFAKEVRETLFGNIEKNDEVSVGVQAALTRLEDELLPIISHARTGP